MCKHCEKVVEHLRQVRDHEEWDANFFQDELNGFSVQELLVVVSDFLHSEVDADKENRRRQKAEEVWDEENDDRDLQNYIESDLSEDDQMQLDEFSTERIERGIQEQQYDYDSDFLKPDGSRQTNLDIISEGDYLEEASSAVIKFLEERK